MILNVLPLVEILRDLWFNRRQENCIKRSCGLATHVAWQNIFFFLVQIKALWVVTCDIAESKHWSFWKYYIRTVGKQHN